MSSLQEGQNKSAAAQAALNSPARRTITTATITSGFKSLRVRNFRLFWIGQVISLTGSWMQTTAQGWLVLRLTADPFAVGLVTTLQFLPVTLLSLFGGVLADRLPKRSTIIVTQVLLMIQAFIFAILVATGAIQLWHVYVLAMIQGIVSAIDNPVRQAFIVEMVGKDDLMNAVSLNSMSFNGARILGPVIAGLVIERLDIAPTLFLNAFSFIPVIWAMMLMNPALLRNTSVPPQGSVLKRLSEGLHYARHTPQILAVLIVVAAIGTFGYNFSVVMPLLGGYVLHTNAEQFGALSAFLGLGSMVAAIGSAYAGSATKLRLLGGSAAFGIVFCLLALSGNFVLSCILLVILGFSGITFATTSNTLLQLNTPDELRGRVMSLNVLLFMGSTPIGALLIGIMSNVFGVSAALFVCGVLCMTGVIGGWLYMRKPNEVKSAA